MARSPDPPPRTACVVIDVGNTSTSLGLWDGRRVSRISAVRGGITHPDEVVAALDRAGAKSARAAMLASVVPAANDRWAWILRRVYGLRMETLTHGTPLPIGVDYPHPEQIGADRLCDAVGAVARHGAPVAVADFGTALTFDVLSRDREYLGGVIAPGLPLMTSYLHEKTAKLPEIDLQGDIEPIGTSTENAMRIGALVGHRGMVREVTRYLLETTGPGTALCATGGYARWALEGTDLDYSIEPDLTLFGLGVIHDYARG